MKRTEHCGVDTCKVRKRGIERENFGRADKGKVAGQKNKNTSDMDCEQGRTFFETDSQRVEHQNHPNLDTSEATRPLREE